MSIDESISSSSSSSENATNEVVGRADAADNVRVETDNGVHVGLDNDDGDEIIL
jgi:hypothetical protein